MAFAAALSEHPLPTHAIGEVVGALLDRLGEAPDLAILFTTAAHTGVVEDLAATVAATLQPRTLIGATAASVVGGPREVEDHPAVALFGARLERPALPIRLDAVQTPDGINLTGFPADVRPGSTVLLIADPYSFPTEGFVTELARGRPDLRVVGGMASAARGPGGNRLVVDGEVRSSGAVGVIFPPEQPITTIVSQGCRPIGDPMVVTRGEGNLLIELAGRPALERLRETVAALPEEELGMARRGLHLGRVIDEHREQFGPGDFLIRNVLGAVSDRDAVAVGDEVEIGATVQFQVRDAGSAHDELASLLAGHDDAQGALLFTCNGRGRQLFDEPDHDAAMVHERLGAPAVAGMFCAGEVGPVGGRNFLHGFTASLLLFESAPA